MLRRLTGVRLPQAARDAYIRSMIRISITPAAFDAIADTLPLGSVGFETHLRTRAFIRRLHQKVDFKSVAKFARSGNRFERRMPKAESCA